jgi:hypothetical protein
MSFARTMLRSAFCRLALARCVVAPLTAIVLIAPLDAALAQSHIVIDAPQPVAGVKPALAKPEREAKSLAKRDRCVEHGACSGLIQSVGSPQPLRPYSFGPGTGGAGGTSGNGSVPADAPPTRPLIDPDHAAWSTGRGGEQSSLATGSAIKPFQAFRARESAG